MSVRGGALGHLACRGVGLEVEELGQQLGPRHAVDGGVVDLRHQTHVAVLEPLDDVHLPQRLGAIELAAAHVAHVAGQLLEAARRRQRGAAQVVVEVEVLVVDPIGVAEAQRHLHQPAPEHGGQGQARPDQVAQFLEGVAAGDGGGVEHRRHRHVHVQAGRLQVQEARVQAGQPLHGASSRTRGPTLAESSHRGRDGAMGWSGAYLVLSPPPRPSLSWSRRSPGCPQGCWSTALRPGGR